MTTKPTGAIALEDGTIFWGHGHGATGVAAGELCFNTAMTGYQEILTDPSYSRQIVTLTYPHIGNTGCNADDVESDQVHAAGLVIRDLPLLASNWRMQESLDDYLLRNKVVAIADIDTRRLTRILRQHGAQAGCILAGEDPSEAQALAGARSFAGLSGMDLAKVVSTRTQYAWTLPSHELDPRVRREFKTRFRVVAYDFGIKQNILRLLVDHGCELVVVPAQTPAREVMALNPHGVFLSNGPGDPEPCAYAIAAIREYIERKIPVFGICLGHQLLGLAVGARTMKMKFGHHGANHPVIDLVSGQVMISSQNHGFAVDEASLPKRVRATHRSLFDDSLQGIELIDAPAFGFQGHPEASPGPRDVSPLFQRFTQMMEARASAAA